MREFLERGGAPGSAWGKGHRGVPPRGGYTPGVSATVGVRPLWLRHPNPPVGPLALGSFPLGSRFPRRDSPSVFYAAS
jgi:hypothetical protein